MNSADAAISTELLSTTLRELGGELDSRRVDDIDYLITKLRPWLESMEATDKLLATLEKNDASFRQAVEENAHKNFRADQTQFVKFDESDFTEFADDPLSEVPFSEAPPEHENLRIWFAESLQHIRGIYKEKQYVSPHIIGFPNEREWEGSFNATYICRSLSSAEDHLPRPSVVKRVIRALSDSDGPKAQCFIKAKNYLLINLHHGENKSKIDFVAEGQKMYFHIVFNDKETYLAVQDDFDHFPGKVVDALGGHEEYARAAFDLLNNGLSQAWDAESAPYWIRRSAS